MAEKSVRRAKRSPSTRTKKRPKKAVPRSASSATLAHERYRAFIENIDDGVYEVDLQGNFTYFNNALCQIFGFPREEIEGASFTKFMDEKHSRAAFEIFNEIYRTGKGIVNLTWETLDQEKLYDSFEADQSFTTESWTQVATKSGTLHATGNFIQIYAEYGGTATNKSVGIRVLIDGVERSSDYNLPGIASQYRKFTDFGILVPTGRGIPYRIA